MFGAKKNSSEDTGTSSVASQDNKENSNINESTNKNETIDLVQEVQQDLSNATEEVFNNNINIDEQLEAIAKELENIQKEAELLALQNQLEEAQNLVQALENQSTASQESLDALLNLQSQTDSQLTNNAVVEGEILDYIFPTSSTAYLSIEDLSQLSTSYLRIARNEIYARHGYSFNSEDLQEYFSTKSWYVSRNNQVTDADLNIYEKHNIQLIKEEEARR